METMYSAIPISPMTTLAGAIDGTQTSIDVVDASQLPTAPNLATIGTGEDAEVILYTGKSTNTLTGVTRGFEGTAKAWGADTSVARMLTAWDLNSIQNNFNSHLADLVTDADGVHGISAESGTFTPVLIGLTTHGTPTYAYQTGKYYRTGKLVNCNILCNISSKGGIVGTVSISGLPFVAAGDDLKRYSASVGAYGRLSGLGTHKQIGGYVAGGDTKINLTSSIYNSDTSLILDTNLDDTFTLQISVTYEII